MKILSKMPTIQNVVCTFQISTCINLVDVAKRAANVEYNPRRFSAIVMRIRDPRTTALIFGPGKVVVIGAKGKELAYRAARKFARILFKLNYGDNTLKNFKIQNIVASFSFQRQIWLNRLELLQHRFCSYEPELFPGLVYRIYNSQVVLLIFQSGKCIITGARHVHQIQEAYENINAICNKFSSQIFI